MPQKTYFYGAFASFLGCKFNCMGKKQPGHSSECLLLFHKGKNIIQLWKNLMVIKWVNIFQNHVWLHTFSLTAGRRALKQVARNTPPPKELLKATTLLYLVILSYSTCIIRTGIRMPPNIRANTPSRQRILATAISILRRWAVIPLQQSMCIWKNKKY